MSKHDSPLCCGAHPEERSPVLGRRIFMRNGGLAVLGLSLVPGFLRRAVFAATPENGRRNILVVIFQRGGADGLNIVVPHGDPNYYAYRPTIAIDEPGTGPGAALDLDGYFGLHPVLEPLKSLYEGGDLAIVQAVGSPDFSRSHFEAQEYMESAAPGNKRVADGWLNRYVRHNSLDEATAFRATSMGENLPRALRGEASAIALGNINQVRQMGSSSLFESLYDEENDALLSGTARDMYDAIDLLRKANPEQYQPGPGVRYPNGAFARQLREVAQLIKADIGLEVAFVDVGGWDHHTDEGSTEGRMSQSLQPIGQTLDAFYKDMGERMDHIVVLTMSEFGRTARENGNRGTDHGHANVMMAMGGPVKGGRIYGDWPGLEPELLNEDRDLAMTTDFRDIFAELLVGHLGCKNAGAVFPGFQVDPARFKGLV